MCKPTPSENQKVACVATPIKGLKWFSKNPWPVFTVEQLLVMLVPLAGRPEVQALPRKFGQEYHQVSMVAGGSGENRSVHGLKHAETFIII